MSTYSRPPGSSRIYADQPSRSPWIAQLEPDGAPQPLASDARADVVVVGAGIAGVATAFFLLRETSKTVLLVERDRVARGATGRNAGQMTSYFERPLSDIAAHFGTAQAGEAQRGVEDAPRLLELMAEEAGCSVRVERFTGHLGLFNLHQLETHLASEMVRRQGGLPARTCLVARDADFLPEIQPRFTELYALVGREQVRNLLEVEHDEYCAVLPEPKGCANSGALAQQVLAHLESRHGGRFRYADCTNVEQIIVADDRAVVCAGGRSVTAEQVVLCTNGFVDHVVQDVNGAPVALAHDQRIVGRIAHMAAFVEESPRSPTALSYVRNTVIGGEVPYVYVTRRTYDRLAETVTLTCMGGPEYDLQEPHYDREAAFPGAMLELLDREVRPYAQPRRLPGQPYDFHWHGLMGYNESGIRVVGAHPRHARLLYNLGCNGVGFLPSIFGAERLARMLGGERLEPSIFDPR